MAAVIEQAIGTPEAVACAETKYRRLFHRRLDTLVPHIGDADRDSPHGDATEAIWVRAPTVSSRFFHMKYERSRRSVANSSMEEYRSQGSFARALASIVFTRLHT